MFLSDLAEGEKRGVLSLAMRLMSIDGDIHEAEKVMLAGMAEDMDLKVERLRVLRVPDAVVAVESEESRETALYELIGLAYADKRLVGAEADFINQLAGAWGFDQRRLDKMIEWVKNVMLYDSQVQPAGRLGYYFEKFAANLRD